MNFSDISYVTAAEAAMRRVERDAENKAAGILLWLIPKFNALWHPDQRKNEMSIGEFTGKLRMISVAHKRRNEDGPRCEMAYGQESLGLFYPDRDDVIKLCPIKTLNDGKRVVEGSYAIGRIEAIPHWEQLMEIKVSVSPDIATFRKRYETANRLEGFVQTELREEERCMVLHQKRIPHTISNLEAEEWVRKSDGILLRKKVGEEHKIPPAIVCSADKGEFFVLRDIRGGNVRREKDGQMLAVDVVTRQLEEEELVRVPALRYYAVRAEGMARENGREANLSHRMQEILASDERAYNVSRIVASLSKLEPTGTDGHIHRARVL